MEGGFYISGEALPFSGVDVKGRMKSTPNEVDASSREGLYDIYMTLEAGKSFTFTEVKGSTTTSYGPDGSYKINQENVDDNYTGAILKGSYAAGGSFTVDESNLYQQPHWCAVDSVAYDEKTRHRCCGDGGKPPGRNQTIVRAC